MYNSVEYILSGEKNEKFEQLFSVHGFRYVEVIGNYKSLRLTAVTCHTDVKQVSYFCCDNDILNRIHNACANSIATCAQTFFVDNPKRDAAWVGDQMLSAEAAAILFNSYDLHLENMLMCSEALTDEIGLPCVVPATGKWMFGKEFSGPDWGDGVVFQVPYYQYKYTGDKRIIKAVYNTAEKLMEYFATLSNNGSCLLNQYGIGDWSAVKPGCSVEVSMSAYYRVCAVILAKFAKILGKDSASYEKLAENIKTQFREKYVKNGKMNGGHITEFLLAAWAGFLSKEEAKDAAKTASEMIKADGLAFTFGAHGLRTAFDVLSENGYAQTVYNVLVNENVLGYAYNIKQGYNTVPERFDWEKDGVFSLNHHFFATAASWFYKWVAGIKVQGLNCKSIEISPVLLSDIKSFKANLRGISVCRENNILKINCPFDFTLKLNKSSTKYKSGSYTFRI